MHIANCTVSQLAAPPLSPAGSMWDGLVPSIGGGSGGDIQFLFADDILGNNPPPYPRHSKQYCSLYKLKEQMQAERVAGFQSFIDDVQKGGFPGPGQLVDAPDGLIDGFLEAVEGD